MKLADFDYALPHELIAQTPAAERTASRLLHLDGPTGAIRDLMFRNFAELVTPDDLLVFNDTRVIKARLTGRKESGGRIEVLVERILTHNEVLAQIRASHPPREGQRLLLGDAVVATVVERTGGFTHLQFVGCVDVIALLDRHGSVPLPPYIEHVPGEHDQDRYQTVYAREPGAVAAPTAGLHFDADMLDRLRGKGVNLAFVTLHVGAGTFQPVRTDDVATHQMHREWYRVPEETVAAIEQTRARGGRVLAVGTTTLRALETAGATTLQAGLGETRLFIVPGYRFRVVDRLLTNFHLPRSTLLMLVSAFGGRDEIRAAYEHAVRNRYRFFSYGDAMLIERQDIPDTP